MIRLMGASLLVAGCAAVGWRHRISLREAVRELEDMIAALDRMRGELTTNRTPLGKLAEELALGGPKAVRCVFAAVVDGLRMPDGEGFASLWMRAAAGVFSGEAASALEQLGSVLGRYSVGEQAAAIDRCAARLEGELAQARERLRRDGALAPALGTAAGLVGSVLLF